MFNLGAGEVILILVVALLVLGPKRLPELARGMGKFLREFRKQTDEVRSVVEREFYKMDQEVLNDGTKPAGTAAGAPPGPHALPSEGPTQVTTLPGPPLVSALPDNPKPLGFPVSPPASPAPPAPPKPRDPGTSGSGGT